LRIERMLGIVVILLNRRKITAKELADRFEISLRTVYRDIEAINMAGIPVLSSQGVDGGYYIPENYKLGKHYLSTSDIKSILSALKGMNNAINDREVALVLEKIEGLVPVHEKSEAGSIDEYIVFDSDPWIRSKRYSKTVQSLYEAVKGRNVVEIRYVDGKGQESIRKVEPMTIILKGYFWYMFGFCKDRDDYRMFKLTRIKSLSILNELFERKNKRYNEIGGDWHKTVLIDIVLKFSSELKHVVDDYFFDADIVEEDGSLTVNAKVPEGDWIYGMVLAYGENIELVSPAQIREKLQTKLKLISQIYDPVDKI